MWSSSKGVVALAFVNFLSFTAAQTYTSCNPLQGTCPGDTALGTSLSVDFTSGASSNNFEPSGTVTYDATNGATFTISEKGDSPQLNSNWYIMFGRVTFNIKAAPGQGVVSSAVLQSDCLDEIDWEWVGSQSGSAQSNYFGKGLTGSWNRGGNHVLSGSTTTGSFHTYTIDWTDERIVWEIDSTSVRVLTVADAETGQYPQTPMQVKVGAWAGGDPSNAAGTISWAGGEIDYSAGPYSMYLKDIEVVDYSTGTKYTYDGTSGTWESISSTGGSVNGNAAAEGSSTVATSVPTVTSTSSVPIPFDSCSGWKACESGSTSTRTGWPWVSTSTSTTSSSLTISSAGVASTSSPSPSSSPSSVAFVASYTGSLETLTTYNNQGSLTTEYVDPQATKTFDMQGSLITNALAAENTASTVTTLSTPATASTTSASVLAQTASGNAAPSGIAPRAAIAGAVGGIVGVLGLAIGL